LDEADLLADNIAVLAAPGKLIAEGSPVTLKRDLGTGYSVQVTFASTVPSQPDTVAVADKLLQRIRSIAPDTQLSMSAHQTSYRLNSKDAVTVESVLRLLESDRSEFGITSCDVHGTSIEEIFLDLMNRSDESHDTEKSSVHGSLAAQEPANLEMDDSRPRTPLSQAWTIFYKRMLIARRSWLTPLLAIVVAVTGSCAPLFFIFQRTESCTKQFNSPFNIGLYLPDALAEFGFSIVGDPRIVASPPGIISLLGVTASSLAVNNVANNTTFVSTIDNMYSTLGLGGVSLDLQSGNSLVAWEASRPGLMGPMMLNLATNILFNHALNVSGGNFTLIDPNYGYIPSIDDDTLLALQWLSFFGAAMVSPDICSTHLSLILTFSSMLVGIPCILLAVCFKGTSVIGSRNAVFERIDQPW
jgi:ATP-binding cassette subfamily A (ABC1) protein 3